MSNFIPVGRIVSSHGLKGQVKVELLTDFPERLGKGQRLRLQNRWVTVKDSQPMKNRLLVKLEGINSIEEAKALQWEVLSAADSDPELAENEFLVEDLIGLKVVTQEGMELGKVDEVLPYPAQDLLKIGELLIPFAFEFVVQIDWDKEEITVKLLPGMLPGEEDE
ncbi:MAG TPA: ribosome maturation factor RimM [Fimbriimonadaceae bacterium]|nr:ribosome maturation factor RimM [Fimbriimonadaceae bacterium]